MFRFWSKSCSVLSTLALVWGLNGCGKKRSEDAKLEDLDAPTSQIEVVDVRGRTVSLKHPAIKIVSLLPSVTEFLFELDKGHLLIGRTNWCRHPAEAQEIEIVGGLENPVVETLVRLQPDLIVAGPFLRNEQVNHLESLGLTVATFDHQNWDTLVRDLKILGKLLNNEGDIRTLISWLEKQRQMVKSVISDREGVSIKTAVLYAFEPLYTTGRGTFVDEMIQLAGGTNIASDLASPWPMLSMETLLEKQPDVLLISTESGAPDSLKEKIRELSETAVWQQLAAIKNNRVYLLDGDSLAVPGPRQTIALRQIAAALHPDLFEAPQELQHVNLLKSPRMP